MRPREGINEPLRKRNVTDQTIMQKTSDALPHDGTAHQATVQKVSDPLLHSDHMELQNELRAVREMLDSLEMQLQSVRMLLGKAALAEPSIGPMKTALSEKASELEQSIVYQLDNRMTALNSKSAALGNRIAVLDSKMDSVRDRLTNLENSQSSGLEERFNPIRTELEKLKKSCQEMLSGSQWKKIEQNLVSVQELQNNVLNVSREIKTARLHEKKKSTSPSAKVYLTWTAVFAFFLIVSALFMTGGISGFDSYGQLKISTLVFFCISMVALIVANILTASSDNGVFTSKAWRKWYYCICGALSLTTFILSFIVLLV